jgi:hypothetical protein
MADAYGNTDVYRGSIEGDPLIFETMPDVPRQVPIHVGRHGSGRDHLAERDGVGGGSWFLIEKYPMLPVSPRGVATITRRRPAPRGPRGR